MTDAKTMVRTALVNSAPLTALVPASRIFAGWPTSFKTLPCISYAERTNYVDDYADNLPASDVMEVEIQVFHEAQKSTTAIAQAVDNAMIPAGWNRDSAQDLFMPEDTTNRKLMTYSMRLHI